MAKKVPTKFLTRHDEGEGDVAAVDLCYLAVADFFAVLTDLAKAALPLIVQAVDEQDRKQEARRAR
jgi:hypothetical protein